MKMYYFTVKITLTHPLFVNKKYAYYYDIVLYCQYIFMENFSLKKKT